MALVIRGEFCTLFLPVPKYREVEALEVAKLLMHGHEVGQHLRGVRLIREGRSRQGRRSTASTPCSCLPSRGTRCRQTWSRGRAAVSSTVSFLPSWMSPLPRNSGWAPRSIAAVVNAERVRVEFFSNSNAMFFPSRYLWGMCCCLRALRCSANPMRWRQSPLLWSSSKVGYGLGILTKYPWNITLFPVSKLPSLILSRDGTAPVAALSYRWPKYKVEKRPEKYHFSVNGNSWLMSGIFCILVTAISRMACTGVSVASKSVAAPR